MLLVLVGTISVLAGFLCLRSPLQTLVVIGLLVGSWWVVTGIAEAVTAITQGAGRTAGGGWRWAC